jgi:hypothetical protein
MISLSRQLGEDFTESVMVGANLTVPFRISSITSRKKHPLVVVVTSDLLLCRNIRGKDYDLAAKI